MSDWKSVAVAAEAMQIAVEAALLEYGPVDNDERAKAIVGQATHALGSLHKYATSQDWATMKHETPTQGAEVNACPTQAEIGNVLDILAKVADVPSDVFKYKSRAIGYVAARSALSWMLYNGVKFVVPPSWPELARMVGTNQHSTLITAARRAPSFGPLVGKMYNECKSRGIETHPRPDWAKEAA